MTEPDKAPLLDDLKRRHAKFVRGVEALTGDLDPQQWQWRPSPAEWSIGEIIQHLLLTHEHYVVAIEAVLAGAPAAYEPHVRSSWFGRRLDALMQPVDGQVPRKLKAPKRLRPSMGTSGQEQLSKLFGLEERFLQQIEAAGHLRIADLKVPFTLIKLLKVPIVDVWRFIASHNERHLLQMQKVKIRMQVRE